MIDQFHWDLFVPYVWPFIVNETQRVWRASKDFVIFSNLHNYFLEQFSKSRSNDNDLVFQLFQF